jgi:hypothetical protein
MPILTRYNTGIVAIILISVAFFIWYEPRYPTEYLKSFEINSPELENKIVIATQLSEFKNAVLMEILRQLSIQQVFIKVIDVNELDGISEKDWDAVVIMHTWENWAPPPAVKTWLEQEKELDRIVVLTTSGNAQYIMQGINAITSASRMSNVASIADEIVIRVNLILNRKAKEHKPSPSTGTWQYDYPPSFP